MPKVSIIVPIYNVEKYLDRCMQSLLGQTLKDIEIILVDDGSPDNCPAMCDEYSKKDPRVKVIHKQNAGLGYARNSGLEIARGEYVGFVDSDDYVSTNMYEMLYAKAKEHGVDAVLCNYYKETKGEITINTMHGISEKERTMDCYPSYIQDVIGCLPEQSANLLYGYSVWKMLFSNNTIKKNNIRFESERAFVSEDILFQLDFSLHASKLVVYNVPFYYYCDNGGSLTKRYDYTRFNREVSLFKEIKKKIDTSGKHIPSIELRLSRLLLYKTLFSVCDTIKYLPFRESVKQLQLISDDNNLCSVLKSYPIEKLPFSQKIFFFLLRRKWNTVIYMMYKLLKHK